MKTLTRILAVSLSLLMLLGAVAVSADDSALLIAAPTEEETEAVVTVDEELDIAFDVYPVFLFVEGPDAMLASSVAYYPADGSVTAGDVIADQLAIFYPELEVVGLEDGYISSLGGVAAGTFGGWDGWLYEVEYYAPDENGEIVRYIDIPAVGVNDYPIVDSCIIRLYYGDFDIPFAGFVVTEDNQIKLVSYTAVYNEDYELVAFDESALAGGTFTFVEVTYDEETGEEILGETYVFTADEDGLTELDVDLTALPNGYYFGSVGAQSEETAEVGDAIITKPLVVRNSDYYYVENEPDPEELFQEKVSLLLIGFMA